MYPNVLAKYFLIVKKILLKYQMGLEAARADGGVLVYHEVLSVLKYH